MTRTQLSAVYLITATLGTIDLISTPDFTGVQLALRLTAIALLCVGSVWMFATRHR